MSESIRKEAPEAERRPPPFPWRSRGQVLHKQDDSVEFVFNLLDGDNQWFGSVRTKDAGTGLAATNLITGRSSNLYRVRNIEAASIQVAHTAAEFIKQMWGAQAAIPPELEALRRAVVQWRMVMAEGNVQKKPEEVIIMGN